MADMGSVGSAISGAGSIASAFGGGGGGGGGGGVVVGGPSPQSAILASQMQSAAAQQAGQLAQAAVHDAIKSINQNYQQARYDVQPYRTAGVQALNELNQYLGLDAYNPGKAPIDPRTWKPSQDDLSNYVKQNITYDLTNSEPKATGPFHTVYTGVGAAYDGGSRYYDSKPTKRYGPQHEWRSQGRL